MNDFAEKVVAVVTGAARGIGRTVCERLLSEGAHVVLLDKDTAPRSGDRNDPARRRLAGEVADRTERVEAWLVADLLAKPGVVDTAAV
ncbi:MAG: SDR family NAD(P)-dependent oxidoreductase, partial [Solirubrobacterales bacterium]